MIDIRARYQGGVFRPLTSRPVPLDEGEVVLLSIERGRSSASHRHQWAWVADAWSNLPETLMDRDWAQNPETLRKHALIATRFAQVATIDCGSNAAALRLKAVLLTQATLAHGYAVAVVRGPILSLHTPESQSVRAMGGDRFRASKTAILDFIADLIGVPAESLSRPAPTPEHPNA